MKKISHVLFVVIVICLSVPLYGMKRPQDGIQIIQQKIILDFPNEILVRIMGHCKPKKKNLLMKVCAAFNMLLKNRELILRANPLTVRLSDIIKIMFECARSGNEKMIDFLLTTVRMYPDRKNCLGMTPLHYAMENNHQSIVQLFIDHGADVHESKPYIYPLHDAVYKGNKECVKSLIAKNVDVNITLENDATPLSIAIHEGHTEIEQLLRDAGAEEASDSSLNLGSSMLRPIDAKKFRALVRRNNNW